MPSAVDTGTPQKQAEPLGLPDGFKVGSAFPFGGLNIADSRNAIDDKEFAWLENYIRIGKGRLRTSYDRGPSLYTAPAGRQIIYFCWFNIGASALCAVFLDNGTAVQVSTTGAVTPISSLAGLFYSGAGLPFACQWGTTLLLICNNNTPNSYWIWDGNILYAPGGLGPFNPNGDITDSGSGYTSAPSLTFFGGSGGGATGVATVVNGSVVAITITNPGAGYLPSDSSVQVAFSGGGSDNSAVLTATLSPGGVDHVELIAGGTGYTSAPAIGFTGGGGSGATAVATESGGQVTAITMTALGSGYTSSPTVTFTGGGGTGASAVSVLSAGSVSAINVVAGGSGFTGTPLLDITGGGGTGAQATAIITAGAISSVTVTDAGSGYTSEPSVVVQTGLNNAAAATIEVMPFGISGTNIETFQSRVWIEHPAQVSPISTGGVFSLSAPGSVTNFATSNGGLTFTNTDRFLRKQYTALRQSNGYLYTLGDSSVGVISNVQSSGNPTTTTFNNQNVDPQTGTSWRDACADYARTILLANPFGVFGIYGGAVTKVSKKLDTLFYNAIFPPIPGALTPSAAVHEMFAQRLYLLLLTITDPFTKMARNVMVGWDETEWSVFSQSATLTFIGTQEVDSTPLAFGTNGSALFPLFQTASAAINKTLQTKYYAGEVAFVVEASYAIYITAENMSAGQTSIVFSSTTVDGIGVSVPISLPDWMGGEVAEQGGSVLMEENPIAFDAPPGTIVTFGTGTSPPVAGTGLGLTMVTSAPDYELHNLQLGYVDVTGIA